MPPDFKQSADGTTVPLCYASTSVLEKKEIKMVITHLLPQAKPPLCKSNFSADFSLSVDILACLVLASCRFTDMWLIETGVVKDGFGYGILHMLVSAPLRGEEGDD
jgi:hypothetical protein